MLECLIETDDVHHLLHCRCTNASGTLELLVLDHRKNFGYYLTWNGQHLANPHQNKDWFQRIYTKQVKVKESHRLNSTFQSFRLFEKILKKNIMVNLLNFKLIIICNYQNKLRTYRYVSFKRKHILIKVIYRDIRSWVILFAICR